ncbi:lactate utilization protein [Chloroflexota bacterium]
MPAQISHEIETTLNALKAREFDARYAENRQAAKDIVLQLVQQHWIVGCGDSTTVRSLGVLQDLTGSGNRVLNSFVKPKIMREKPAALPLSVMKQTAYGCDVFICSSNAVTMDGKLVNTDGGGMRVSGMAFGSPLKIIVAGRNKIVKNVDEALDRIKNVIALAHAKTIGTDWGIPCASAGKCVEPETLCPPGKSRICNITMIMEARPAVPGVNIVVILVDDDLGLGWDPAWPRERIDRIYAEYKEFTPPHRPIR